MDMGVDALHAGVDWLTDECEESKKQQKKEKKILTGGHGW